jgi:hypothetical protein
MTAQSILVDDVKEKHRHGGASAPRAALPSAIGPQERSRRFANGGR